MEHEKLELALLIALCDEWFALYSMDGIGSDVAKIRLLKRFARESNLSASDIPEPIRQMYAEVFLRSFDEVRSGDIGKG